MGRPRTPTALKVIAGTDRADRRNGSEPEPLLLDDLEPPAHLPERSADVWREWATKLRRMGVLSEVDTVALEMFCDAVADYRLARLMMQDALMAECGKAVNQLLIVKSMSSKRAQGFMTEFGMTPASRSRLAVKWQGDLFSPAADGPGRFFGN